jgi:hypothetical protein
MSLYNPGFLGEHFNWWIGQIADDSTWRDNILPGKFADRNSVVGWGYRYKVRIIGLHDQEEDSLRSEELAWAQVMYPVTAGGGQAAASQTPNLRQGNFVFGFFLDGQDQQTPVIMGVLGNNAQTSLSNKTALTGGKNFSPQSGFANTQEPKERSKKEKVPDEEKVLAKPKSPEQAAECAPVPPGVSVNKYGLRSDKALTSSQLADAQNARAEAEKKGLTGTERDDYIQRKVAQGIKNRCREASSSASLSQPGATKESTNAVHQTSAGDRKREDKYQEKIPLMKPDDKVGSAIKCIQTVLDNLMQQIAKYLNALKCYADAASLIISKIINLISKAACIIAKYMKIIFDKIMEYVLKLLNKELTKVVSAIPSSMRNMFADIKETITELILCLYNKITQGLCALIESLLLAVLKPDQLEQQARDSMSDQRKVATVPVCYAEEIVGQVISSNKDQITEANNTILDNINTFLDDIQNQIAGVSGALSDITSLTGNINGSLTSALSFTNLKLNIFGCELKPNVAVSDFYTFARGGASQPDQQLPNNKSVENNAAKDPPNVNVTPETPYAEIPQSQRDLTSDSRTPDQIAAATSGTA